MAALTIALVVLRLRGPHTPLARLAREPGTVACTAVLLAALADLGSKLNYLAYWAMGDRVEGPLTFIDFVLTPRSEFLAVAASWSVLAAGGRWRPSPDWAERSGVLLGVFWLMAPPVMLLVEILGAVARNFFPGTS